MNIHAQIHTKVMNIQAQIHTKVMNIHAQIHTKVMNIQAQICTKVMNIHAQMHTKVINIHAQMHTKVMNIHGIFIHWSWLYMHMKAYIFISYTLHTTQNCCKNTLPYRKIANNKNNYDTLYIKMMKNW